MHTSTPDNVNVNEISFRGWPAVQLANELVTAVVVPAIGGRLINFQLGSYQYLFMNDDLAGKLFTAEENQGDGSLAAFKNYGGDKTWPAPQGWDHEEQWHGPPDAVLDSGRYASILLSQDGVSGVKMSSPSDPRTGLRIHREISIVPATSKIHLNLSFENVTDRPVRWAIWDNAQLVCATKSEDGTSRINENCWLYIPTRGSSGTRQAYRLMFGEENEQWQGLINPQLLAVQYRGDVGKIGVDSPDGWIAFSNHEEGYVLCMRFPYEEGAEYPDGGSSVECWTESPGAPSSFDYESPGYILEAEILGPLRSIPPGEQTTLNIEWAAAYCPGPILDVSAYGCVNHHLQADVNGDWVNISGTFGVFVMASAALAWLDDNGQTVHLSNLQSASPLAILQLDAVLRIPAEAAKVSLVLRDDKGNILGTLDESSLV